MKRKYNVNDDFFRVIDSEQKAYLLGFFLADGTYRLGTRCTESYRFSIHLQESDVSVINWFRDFIVPEKEPTYKAPFTDKKGTNHKGSYNLTWTSSIMNKDLELYNITPRKTYDISFQFPFDKIPEKFIWDFIRGFFDGDGQVSYSEKTHQMTFALYGTSKEFMTKLGELFEKEFGVEKRVEGVQKSNMVLYTLRFSAGYNRKKFIDQLYNKLYSNKHFFLERKQSKMLNYLLFKYRDNPEDCEILLCFLVFIC